PQRLKRAGHTGEKRGELAEFGGFGAELALMCLQQLHRQRSNRNSAVQSALQVIGETAGPSESGQGIRNGTGAHRVPKKQKLGRSWLRSAQRLISFSLRSTGEVSTLPPALRWLGPERRSTTATRSVPW